MVTASYEKLEGNRAAKLIGRLNRVWSGSAFDAERTAIHIRELPFAKGWKLAEISDALSVPEKKCVALDNNQECVLVAYDNDFVPAFARAAKVRLAPANAADYVRFWFEYARAGSERFILVESIEDIPWREEPTPQARKSLGKSVHHLVLTANVGELFTFSASVLFRDTLFDCLLGVTAQGQVSFVQRSVIAESLTVIDPVTGF